MSCESPSKPRHGLSKLWQHLSHLAQFLGQIPIQPTKVWMTGQRIVRDELAMNRGRQHLMVLPAVCVAQLEEPGIVIPGGIGSKPIAHPKSHLPTPPGGIRQTRELEVLVP